MNNSSLKEENAKTLKIVFTILIFVITLMSIPVVIYAYHFHDYILSNSPDRWGLLGDYVGGILNPIVAFAALVAVLYAIYLQRSELHETKIALTNQASLMDEQIFDSKLFSSTVRYSLDGKEFDGYEAIRECLYELLYKTSDFAEYYRVKNEQGFEGDFYQLLSDYTDYYLGTSTMFMVVTRITDIANMISNSKVVDKQHYHNLFASYISKEAKIWMYIYFVFSKQQGKVPPEYGCQGMFMQYFHEELPSKVEIPTETLNFISSKIQSIVNKENTA